MLYRKLGSNQAWALWHYGDRDQRIRPYKKINPRVDFAKKSCSDFSKLKFVMSQLPTPPLGAAPDAAAWKLVDEALAPLHRTAYGEKIPTNVANVSFVTMYDKLHSLRKRRAANQDPLADDDDD